MMVKRRAFTAILALWAAIWPLQLVWAGSMRGVLKDEQGKPVAGAQAVLARVHGRYGKQVARYAATTDVNGVFVIKDIAAGKYHYLAVLGPSGPVLLDRNIDVAETGELHRELTCSRIKDTVPLKAARDVDPKFADGKNRSVQGSVVLQESVGWAWRNEMISETFSFKPGNCVAASLRLVNDSDDTSAVPVQLADMQSHPDGSIKNVTAHFRIDLDPWQVMRFSLYGASGKGHKPVAAGNRVRITKHDDMVELSNKNVCLLLGGKAGPVVSISTTAGKALALGRVRPEREARFVSSTITDNGPLFVSVEMVYVVDGARWTITVRLDAGAPYALVTERALAGQDAFFELIPSAVFDANMVNGKSLAAEPRAHVKKTVDRADVGARREPGKRVVLDRSSWQVGWLGQMPWGRTSFAFGAEGEPSLAVFARDRDDWQMPSYGTIRLFQLAERTGNVTATGDVGDEKIQRSLIVRFPLCAPVRRWGIAVLAPAEPVPDGKKVNPMASALDEMDAITARVSDNPLDVMRHVMAPWAHVAPDHYPCLLPRRMSAIKTLEDLDTLLVIRRRLFVDEREMPAKALNWWMSPSPFLPAVHGLLANSYVRLGMNHNANSWNLMLEDFDIIARWPGMMTEQEERLARSAIAVFAYKLRDLDWWPAQRMKLAARHPESIHAGYGIRNTPAAWYGASNQNVDRYWALANAALLLPNHPRADDWMDHVLDEFDGDMRDNPMQSGVWPEGFRYAFFNFYNWLTLATTLEHNGVRNYFKHPYFKYQYDYARIVLTPPDPRFKGQRVVPPVGDSDDRPGGMGVIRSAAHCFRKHDPAFARELMWHFKSSNHDGNYYWRSEFDDGVSIKARPVALVSQLIRGYGAVLRSNYNTADETYFLIKNSRACQHWHRDELGFHYYGLGVPLLCDPGGYYSYPLESQHNTVRFHRKSSWCRGEPLDFRAGDGAALFVGEVIKDNFVQEPPDQDEVGSEYIREPSSHRRHVMMVDDTYFLIYDQVQSTEPSELFLQAVCTNWTQSGATLEFLGKHGVDFNVHIFEPAGAAAGQAYARTDIWADEVTTEKEWNHPFGRSVVVTNAAGADYFWCIAPYRRGQPAPQVRSVSKHGVEIRLPTVRIVAFLAPSPVHEYGGDVEFRGKSGAVIVRDGKPKLTVLDGRWIRQVGSE